MTNPTFAAEQLRQFIERIERLEDEKANLAEDIREVYAEAKSNGYDIKTMRQVIKIRKLDQGKLEEQEYLLEVYRRALGMLPSVDEADAA